MSTAIVASRGLIGIAAPEVTVEVHLAGGLPAFHLVGLPEAAVRESRVRVRSALQNSRFDFPPSRITVNLAPADLPKEGTRFDLAIAVGILIASGQIPAAVCAGREYLGELALTGDVRPIRGVLPAAMAAEAAGTLVFVHPGNAAEAALVPAARVATCESLRDLVDQSLGRQPLRLATATGGADTGPAGTSGAPDFSEVVGQHGARRALEIAAAGGHNVLLTGPPGTGKTMLAQRLPGILPPLGEQEYLEVAALHALRNPDHRLPARRRPFRAPHHSASAAALVGGGARPRPGEVSLAHRGVLFLDEFPEFSRHVLETLREPLESRIVTLARAACQAQYPADFQLVAAMNPCPCGYDGAPAGACRCTQAQIATYRGRVSGPLLDRMDLSVTMQREPLSGLFPGVGDSETSAEIRARVSAARERQVARQGVPNARLTPAELERLALIDAENERTALAAAERFGLSRRGLARVVRVAVTIADLTAADRIEAAHLLEALRLRVRHQGPS